MFYTFFQCFIIDFEQVNVCRVVYSFVVGHFVWNEISFYETNEKKIDSWVVLHKRLFKDMHTLKYAETRFLLWKLNRQSWS